MVMHFCTSITAMPPPQLSFCPHPLQTVQSTMLLDITMDDQMNWKQHVMDVVRATLYKLQYYMLHTRALGTSGKVLCSIYYS